MKTNLAFFAVLAAGLAACEQEAISPGYVSGPASSNPILSAQQTGGLCVDFSYELKTYSISDDPGTTLYECVIPKVNCSKIIPCPSGLGGNKKESGSNVGQALREFLGAVNKNRISDFFHTEYVRDIFPQLETNKLALDMLRSGALEIIRKPDANGGDLFIAVPKGTKHLPNGNVGIVLNVPRL